MELRIKTSTPPRIESPSGALISVALILLIIVAGAFHSVSERLAQDTEVKTSLAR